MTIALVEKNPHPLPPSLIISGERCPEEPLLKETEHDAGEGRRGTGELSGFGTLQLVGSGLVDGEHLMMDLSRLTNYVILTKFNIEVVLPVPGLIRKGGFMFLVNLKDAYFWIPIRPDSRPHLLIAFGGKVYQFKALFRLFDSSLGPPESVCFGSGMGLSEGDLSPALSR